MKRQGITLISGILAVGCLTGAYYMLKAKNERTKEEEASKALGETVIDLSSSEITELSFWVEGEKVSFALGGDGDWQLQEDKTFPVNSGALLAFTAEAAPLRAVRILTDTAELSEYGLEEPQNVITLADKEGKKTTLTIGARNSSTGDDYLMLNEDSSVIYTVGAAFGDAFSDELYDYAQGEELPMISAADITEISVNRSADSYRLYLENAIWKIGQPQKEESEEGKTDQATTEEKASKEPEAEGKADAEAVNDALAKVSGFYYNGYLDHDCKDAAAYGLDSPTATLTIIWKEEAEADEEETVQIIENHLTLIIGSTDENGNYYVQQQGSGEVHTMPEAALNLLLTAGSTSWLSAKEDTSEAAAD